MGGDDWRTSTPGCCHWRGVVVTSRRRLALMWSSRGRGESATGVGGGFYAIVVASVARSVDTDALTCDKIMTSLLCRQIRAAVVILQRQ